MKLFYLVFIFSIYLFADSPISPIPKAKIENQQKVKLGYILFYDPNLSKDKKISCVSCHKKEYGGADNREKSIGVFQRVTKYNTPSIYNLKYQFVFGWEKKSYDLKEKIENIMKDSTIMEADFQEIVKYLKDNTFYNSQFLKVYKKIDKEAVIDALYNYILTLNSTNSKFDNYLLGKVKLSNKELKGYELFKKYGCIACHNGKTVGGQLYFRYGYFSKKNGNKLIKCPSLREVKNSAPYFHNGEIKRLKDAIRWMTKVQLGRDISDKDVDDIASFLKTLSGK